MFKVVDGIYQVRGYDMSNLTLVEGETGWIVFDTLMSVECSQAALALANEHLGGRPVRAVIVSHPHIDHYGGIKGIMSTDEAADRNAPIEEQLASGKIPIIVPTGFFGARRVREHVRRLRHEAPRRVPIRRLPGQRPARVTCHGHRQRAVGRQNKLHPPHVRSGNIRRMTDHRRRAHAVPADARHRSADGNEHVDPRAARAVGCRKLHRHAAQPVHAARRPGARRQRVGEVHHRGRGPLRQRCGGHVPKPQLAPLGKRGGQRLHGEHGSHLQIHQ